VKPIKLEENTMRSDMEAKQAITEALYRYCRAMDRIDPELAKTVWHADATLDYGDLFKLSAAEYTASIEAMHASFDATHHQVGNILIDVEGDRATSEAYVTARCWNFLDSGELKELIAIGRYCDRWSCRNGHWAIDHRHFVLDMMYSWVPPRVPVPTGNVADRNRDAIEGRRGVADPSHELVGAITRKAALA
jgi:SnoaL-like domain